MSSSPGRIPRTAWLAVGVAAAAAASARGVPAAVPLVAGLLVARRRPARRIRRAGLSGRPSRRSASAPCCWPSACSSVPAASAPPPLPEDRGPWTAVVESVGSPRDGDQVARLRLLVDTGEVLVAATLPAYPAVTAGDRRRGRRPPPTTARRRSLRRVPAPVRRGRHARRPGARARGDPAGRPPDAARRQRRRAPARAARARGRAGRRDPRRPARARGSLARRRLRDRRREPRRRDLGLEHRDRRGPGRDGAPRPIAAARVDRDPGHGRRLRGRRRRLVVGRPRRGHGRRRAARPRERTGRAGARGARASRRRSCCSPTRA